MATRLLRTSAAVALLTLAAVAPALPRGASAATFVGPKQYYLALGDSITYGAQPNGDNSHGFADDFFQYLQARGTTTLVNYACVHETTATFMNGGCPEASSVKSSYGSATSQLAAALAFIQAHPGQVSPVTIEIGAADVDKDINESKCTFNTINGLLDGNAAITNFGNILNQLKSALNGTGDLIALNYFDPYQNACPQLASNAVTFNSNLASTAQKAGVPIVDVYAAFGGSTTPNPTLCTYSWTYTCGTNPTDILPNSQGYSAIASAAEALVNYPLPVATATKQAGGATATTSAGQPTPQPTATSGPQSIGTPGPEQTDTIVVLPNPPAPHPACRPQRATLTLSLHPSGSVASGQTISAVAHAAAGSRLTVTLHVDKQTVSYSGSGAKRKKVAHTSSIYSVTARATTDRHGNATLRWHVTYPASAPTTASLTGTVAHGCDSGTATWHLKIVPAAHHT